ncbi:MAG: PAS domain S-box protein [Desulfomonile tiedjei]|uniref:histidine kinase n=1 Tax=Desulfomonile tiedjei TaxID=2358 RepID=A0A9D6UZS7_9BACT|nr:PAS domain S-box protein [Desulfomonile tiedjei]
MTADLPENTLSLEIDPIEKIILRSMAEGVITLECTGRIFTINPAALRTLGYVQEQMEGRLFEEVFASEPFNDDFRLFFASMMRDAPQTSNRDVQYKRPDGQVVDLSITAGFLDLDACNPGLQNVVVVFRDVTAFKALERMKRRAVNHLSHELRTPLAVISASLENISADDLPRDRLQRNLERIHRNLKRLVDIQGIVEEMLDPPQFRPESLFLPSTIEPILEKLRSEFSHRRVTVTSRVVPEQTDILDPVVLRIALESLVKNAVEATPDGGEVLVSVDPVLEGILIKVEDRGFGIPLRDQEFIFEGLHHTQATVEYSSKRPYDFNAGGKGLELLRLKTMAEAGYFEISFTSDRCRYIPENTDHCTGDISSCPHIEGPEGCRESGGTIFSVLFRSR